ncbi:MAG: HYExAFE family protein [Planctomycetota bacterium]
MQTERGNLYEQAFESWLGEHKIPFRLIDQTHNGQSGETTIKSFDFLIYPNSQMPVLVELKGRTYEGTNLAGLKGLDAWVTYEDVEALSYWHDEFSKDAPGVKAIFVFLFRFANVEVETDGWEIYEAGDDQFLILAIDVEKYQQCMKSRSPKWKTVTMAAEDFRQYAKPVKEIIKRTTNRHE